MLRKGRIFNTTRSANQKRFCPSRCSSTYENAEINIALPLAKSRKYADVMKKPNIYEKGRFRGAFPLVHILIT